MYNRSLQSHTPNPEEQRLGQKFMLEYEHSNNLSWKRECPGPEQPVPEEERAKGQG